MNKKNILIIGLILAFLVAVVLLRGPVQRAARWVRTADQVFDMVDKWQDLLEVSPAEIERIIEQWEEDRKEIGALIRENKEHLLEIKALEAKIDALPVYEIPEASTVHPKDYEECITELERSRLRGDTLVMIIDTQREEIALLRSVNHSQGLIITSQADIILKQGSHIEQFEALLDDHNRKVNRRILIVSLILGAAALVL